MTEDRSPIADRGDVAPTKGLASLFRRSESSLPVPQPGQKLLVVGANGSVTAPNGPLSAAERHKERPTAWLLVDMREHPWTLEVPFEDTRTAAGFVATVTVTAGVTDAVVVAEKGIESIVAHLHPALSTAVADAAALAAKPSSDPSTTAGLRQSRERMTVAVREHLDARLAARAPTWLVATVTSVSVDFDAATRQHHDALVERSRAGAVIAADTDNDLQRERGEIERRKLWRDALAGLVDSPVGGLLETAAADPTRDNIAAAATQVQALFREGAEHHREIMRELIRGDYFEPTDAFGQKLMDVLGNSATDALSMPVSALPAGRRHDPSQRQLEGGADAQAPAEPKTEPDGEAQSGREQQSEPVDADTHTKAGGWRN